MTPFETVLAALLAICVVWILGLIWIIYNKYRGAIKTSKLLSNYYGLIYTCKNRLG